MLDYNGFLLMSCTLEQKRELQKRQNNAIRTYLLYKRRDHITLDRLHAEMNLLSLEQRRIVQLLKLIFVRSKKVRYIKKPIRVLRANAKVQFKLMSKCSSKYLNSPMYRGSVLWNALPEEEQRVLSTLYMNRRYCVYENLLY